MPKRDRMIRNLEDKLKLIRYQADTLLADGVGLNSLTDLFKQIDAVEAEISRLRESGAPRRRSKSRTSRDNRRDQQPNDGMVAAIVSKWFRDRNRALGKRVLGVCRSTPAQHICEYEPRQIVLAGLLSVMEVTDVESALRLDLSVPDDHVPILVRIASEYAAQGATRTEPVSVNEVLELAQVISTLPNQAQLDDIAWLSAIVFWRADWWAEVGDIVETARLAIHLNVHGLIDLEDGPKLEKLRVLESIFSVARPVLIEDTEVLALASVEVLNFILARRLHERGLECMTSFASVVKDLQASIDLSGLAADLDDSLKDADPCWLVPFAARFGLEKTRGVFARLTSPEGDLIRCRSKWGLLRPVGTKSGDLTPAELELLFGASLEARQARLFINEPGLPLPQREILDVAVVASCASQYGYDTPIARLVPNVGIVVTDWSSAAGLAGTHGPEFKIPRDARIGGYSSALMANGAGFLAEIAKDFVTRIVQSILVSGISQDSATRITEVVCRHDDLRKQFFSHVEEAYFKGNRRLGKVLKDCPEIVKDTTEEALTNILQLLTKFMPGKRVFQNELCTTIEQILFDRVRTAQKERADLTQELSVTTEILQHAVGMETIFESDIRSIFKFLSANSKRATDKWVKAKRIVASWLRLLEAEKNSDELPLQSIETIIAKLDALDNADPFVTYANVMTPERIARWTAGIRPKNICLLPLGLVIEVLSKGEKLFGKFLEPDDKRGVVLGEITHCCQSPGAAGDLAAWFGHEDYRAGFFVVTTAYGFILCMSMVWVDTQTNTVVFDNIEHNRYFGDDGKAIALSVPVYNQIARILHERFGFKRVLCGVEYSTWAPGKWSPAELPIPKPICTYSDARDQVDLLKPTQ